MKSNLSKDTLVNKVFQGVTLSVIAGVAIFLGYLIGQYAITYVTSPLGHVVIEQTSSRIALSVDSESPSTSQGTEPASRSAVAAPSSPPASGQPTPAPAAVPIPVDPIRTESWEVQVGAFSKREQADRLAQDVRSQGYSVNVIPGNLVKVRVGPFGSRPEAEATRDKLVHIGIKDSFLVRLN